MSDRLPLHPISNSILKCSIPSSRKMVVFSFSKAHSNKTVSSQQTQSTSFHYISLNHIYFNSSGTCYWYKYLKHKASSYCPFISICENTKSPGDLPKTAKEATIASKEMMTLFPYLLTSPLNFQQLYYFFIMI